MVSLFSRWQSPIRTFLMSLVAFVLHVPAQAQLNENCVVSVLNRNVQARADGTWVLPNIPANFGTVRARATCVQGGVTTYGESAGFTIPPNGSVTLPPIVLGPTTPIPTALRLISPQATLASVGATVQLQALATYPHGGAQVDVTGNGTAYGISNPTIATVTPAGLVTALRSGTVVVQAINEGTQGILMLRVALAGADSDGDGIPDDEEIRLGMDPNNPADALLDLDRDGLNARDEYLAGTDPRNPDTDGDGISDGDEVRGVRGFVTNPLLADTDGDGIRDATEIATGSDPTNPASYNLAAAMASMRVSPGSFTLIVNSLTGSASVQLSVIGTLVDGFEINLTSTARQTTYASSNLGTCNFGAPDGRVFASAAGSCNITVRNNGREVVVAGTVQDFAPSALSFVAIPGYANGVAVSGDFAFVAAGSTGLQVVSLSADRRTPAVVASLNVGGNANDVTLAGNIAYLATGAGLKVVDVSTPAAPRLLGTFGGVGNALGVKVRGTTAYVTGGSSLYIVSVANPGAMIQAGAISLGGTAWNLDLDPTRNLAAVAAGSAGLKLVDVSNLSAPLLRGTVATGDARGVALRGNHAIVADHANSMRSVNITNLAAPTIVSTTAQNLGGLLNGVALTGNFAVGADVLFVNGVPIVDIANPTALAPRAILNFPGDFNGMGIAVDNSFIYLAADSNSLTRGGSSGNSRLYIGQYQPREDLAGVAPTATITSPTDGNQVYEGAPLTMTVDAVDDVSVASVRFLVAAQVAFTSTTAPHQYTFTVPSGVSNLTLGAVARDLGGNEGTAAPVSVVVAPDPLTRVIGLVMDVQGAPIEGAQVTAPGGRTGTTGADGRFQIVGVPTVLGNLVVQASYTPPGGITRTGSSAAIAPVLGGVTDVGALTLIEALFETDYGSFWTSADDTFTARTMQFSFPFYGQNETIAYVGTNGYITFGSGDNNYVENIPSFNSLKRIAAFFDDLYGRSTGRVYIKELPDRLVVTHDRVQHFSTGGSNTLQLQLHRDGRIVFAYKGITALNTGTIVGLTPGPNSPFLQVDFSATPSIEVPPGTAVYEYFTGASRFDLDQAFVVFTPKPGGGYSVRTILPPAAPLGSTINGAAAVVADQLSAPTALRRAAQTSGTASGMASRAPSAAELANAEVIVHSSSNRAYRGMTNTDAQGRFSLSGVPVGGVDVQVRRNGVTIARGAANFPGGALNQAQFLNIELVSPDLPVKSGPVGQ